MEQKILFKQENLVGKIIFNNPKKLNSFDFETIKQLDKILEKIKKSKLKTVIITGTGKSFSAGGDIAWEKSVGSMSKNHARQEIKFVQKTFAKIESLPQVFIALINGYAIGGGNELAMACDIRIALPKAKFIHPETSLGTIAPLGGTKRLPRLIGLGRAKYVLLTGATIDSKTALSWGLVDFLVSEKKIKSFLNSLLSKITKNPLESLGLTKKSVNSNYTKDLLDDFELNSYIKCSRTKINKETLDKFLKKGKN